MNSRECTVYKLSLQEKHLAEELLNIKDVCVANGYPWEKKRTAMEQKWTGKKVVVGGAVASWLVRLTPEKAVWV